MTFLIGDVVTLVTEEGYSPVSRTLQLGVNYTVNGFASDGYLFFEGVDNGDSFCPARFELAKKTELMSGFLESLPSYERGYQQGWHDALVWAGI